MHSLDDLAGRCEAASGADRELDAAIADAIRWWPVGYALKDASGPERRWCDDRRIAGGLPFSIECPPFSFSLDAAMSLVPEGWVKTIADWLGEDNSRAPFFADCADLAEMKAGNEGSLQAAWAQTPALALCAAALRARSHALSKGKNDDA